MGPSLPWFSAFLAVLAGVGRTPPESHLKPQSYFLTFSFIGKSLSDLLFKISNHNPSLMFFFHLKIAQLFAVQDKFTQKTQDWNLKY